MFEFFGLERRVDPIDHVVVRLLLLLLHLREFLEVLLSIRKGITVNIINLRYLRLLTVALRHTGEGRRQGLRNLRFHHFVESLSHFFFVRLDLAHRRDVPLRDLMVILHVVLQRLIIIILNFLLRH